MIKKYYVCAKCQCEQEFDIFEAGEPIPMNVTPAKPRCKKCHSDALINKEELENV